MKSPDQEFLDNLCKILGHNLNPEFIVNDYNKMVIHFEKTCYRCNRSGKATVRYNDLAYKKFDIYAAAKERVDWNFNSSPHKKP